MLDPITSLLAACVNCNPPDSSAVQPDVAICTNNPRSSQNAAQQQAIQQNSLSTCMSPPEATPESLPLSFKTAETVDANQRQPQNQIQNQTGAPPRPAAPEAVAAVSWSNPTTRRTEVANAEVVNAEVSNTKVSNTETSNAANPVLRFGSRGQDVARLQTRLQQLKLYRGAIDGIFGQQTKAAVVQFQQSKGLQTDGVVGTNTWTALQSVARQSQSTSPTQAQPQPNRQSNTQNPTQGNTQANTQGDRPNTTQPAPVPAPVPAASPKAETPVTQSSDQESKPSDQESDSSPQFPFNSLWIVGWGIIYGSGWIFILKDTVKEIKGFHFVITTRKKTTKQTTRTVVSQAKSKRKVVPKVVIPNPQTSNTSVQPSPSPASHNYSASVESQVQSQSVQSQSQPQVAQSQSVQSKSVQSQPVQSQPVQPINLDSSDRTNTNVSASASATDRSHQHTNHNHEQNDRSNVKPFALEQFALEQFVLADPWQDEAEAFSVQIFEVALADGGQILPIQNVFIAPPRSRFTRTRKRPKNPALISNYSYYSYPKPVTHSKSEVASNHDAQNRHQQAKAG